MPHAAALLALLVVGSLSCDDLCRWTAWKAEYSRSYSTPEVEEYRFNVFISNVAEYARRNAEPGQTAVYGPDRFADLTTEEFAEQYLRPEGLQRSELADRPIVESPELASKWRRASTPATFTTPYTTSARQQGSCGACWAFTTAAILEGAHQKATAKSVLVSPQNLLDCAQYRREDAGWNGCRGYTVVDMLAELADAGGSGGGVALESDYPYNTRMGTCKRRLNETGAVVVESYFTEAVDETEGSTLYSRLQQYGPLGVAINSGGMKGYKGGIIRHNASCLYTSKGYYAADHAVTLVGWGEQAGLKYWLVLNSWGADWGEPLNYTSGGKGEGYFRLERGVSACHIADHGAVGAVAKGHPTPTPTPGPQPCSPLSKEAVCGARQCGSVDNGCGFALACGYCASYEVCSANGTCDVVQSEADWWQYYPPGTSGDFNVTTGASGLELATFTSSDFEKRVMWNRSWLYTSESWTSFGVQFATSSTGVVGIGMRGGQGTNGLSGISWKLSVLSYTEGPLASAYLLQCLFRDYDECQTVAELRLAMNIFHNFTVNFGLQCSGGSWNITTQPWLDGASMTGSSYYTVDRNLFPAVGSAFIVASGGLKTFRSPLLATRTTVQVAMQSCLTEDQWGAQVSRTLSVPGTSVADVRGARSAGSSCGDGEYDTFNVTLLDSNTTVGILGQATEGAQAVGELTYSNALASRLTEAVAGGGLANVGIAGAQAAVVFPVAAGTPVASVVAAGAAAGGLSAGAIVGIAVGGAVAAAAGAAVAGVAVYAATRPEPSEPVPEDFQPRNPMRKTFYKIKVARGVDVMSNGTMHQSITGRAPPVSV
eukprot:m51a1_g7462 hypothetical protein (826) ;mRNA; f:150939-153623